MISCGGQVTTAPHGSSGAAGASHAGAAGFSQGGPGGSHAGQSGASGNSGASGHSGASGNSGASGASSGASGNAGAQSGASGNSGASGASSGAAGQSGSAPVGGAGQAGFGGDIPDASSDFIDPGCMNDAGPIIDNQCDPFQQPPDATCGPGQACMPFVIYPTAPCMPQTYGTQCTPAGVGMQGDSCSSGNCSAGFVCLITGQGTQCAQLCQLNTANSCPGGYICEPFDIPGYGGCL